MQHKRTPMPKCDFNNIAKQLYWNHTSAWVFFCKFAAYFQNTFYSEHLWTAASEFGYIIEQSWEWYTYLEHSGISMMKLFGKIVKPQTIFAKKIHHRCSTGFWICLCSYVLESSDQCEENTKKRPMWDWKIAKYKSHVPYKKQKATKIEES